MIQGKCMQVLLDKMDNDPDWDNTSESYNPLTLLNIIGKKNCLRPKINIDMQQFTINSVHCMESNNTA